MSPIAFDEQLHIIVVGGSLAGLFNAIVLRRLGHRVTILERSPVALLHDQGAGVVSHSQTLEWVEKYGKSRRTADDISVLSQQRLYLDQAGNVIDTDNREQRMTSWGVLYNIGRECFDGAGDQQSVATKDDEANYEYGRTVTAIKEKGSQLEVTFVKGRPDEDGKGEESVVEGDFVIVADGPSSHMRKMLLGESAALRTYAGYVAFRGTVPEEELSQAAKDVFVEKFSFYHGEKPNTQILAYTIPNAEGSLEKGERFVNWVWYHNVTEDSDEYRELMTDSRGNTHRFTLPTGGHMQTDVWERQKETARNKLPPQFAELVTKTQSPFVQAITDVGPPTDTKDITGLMGGKAIIVGDALCGFRPHTAASTTQACHHALELNRVFRKQISWDEYAESVLGLARQWHARGIALGERSQFGKHPLAA